eukprot:2854809-Pyramimonas_sp.AAC.1
MLTPLFKPSLPNVSGGAGRSWRRRGRRREGKEFPVTPLCSESPSDSGTSMIKTGGGVGHGARPTRPEGG